MLEDSLSWLSVRLPSDLTELTLTKKSPGPPLGFFSFLSGFSVLDWTKALFLFGVDDSLAPAVMLSPAFSSSAADFVDTAIANADAEQRKNSCVFIFFLDELKFQGTAKKKACRRNSDVAYTSHQLPNVYTISFAARAFRRVVLPPLGTRGRRGSRTVERLTSTTSCTCIPP